MADSNSVYEWVTRNKDGSFKPVGTIVTRLHDAILDKLVDAGEVSLVSHDGGKKALTNDFKEFVQIAVTDKMTSLGIDVPDLTLLKSGNGVRQKLTAMEDALLSAMNGMSAEGRQAVMDTNEVAKTAWEKYQSNLELDEAQIDEAETDEAETDVEEKSE